MPEMLYPYDVLSTHGIHPNSSVMQVQDFAPLERKESEAWRVLRDLRLRLKADFFLYQVQDEERLARFQEYLGSARAALGIGEIRHHLREDTPIVLLLIGKRGDALQILEQQLEDGADCRTAHWLALSSYAEAQHYEDEGDYDKATQAWHRTIASWVRTLIDDDFWEAWCAKRQKHYGTRDVDYLGNDLRKQVRKNLREHLAAEFTFYADHYAREGKQERAQAHRDLKILYEIEWQGASLLKASGGLRLDNQQSISCGPLLLRRCGLERQLSAHLATLADDLKRYLALPDYEAMRAEAEPKVSGEEIKQIRYYFSQLATTAVLLDQSMPKEALSYLPTAILSAADLKQNNPAYLYLVGEERIKQFRKDVSVLAIEVYVAISRLHITSTVDLQAAAEAWREALRRARAARMESEAAKAISDLVIGRTRALQKESRDNQFEALNEAVPLLETAYSILRDADEGEIARELADALRCRGTWHREWSMFKLAVDDFKRAFDLNPNHLVTRDDFCSGLITYAEHLAEEGDKDEALSLLSRAENLIDAGLRMNPESEALKDTLHFMQWVSDAINGKDPGEEAWADLEQALIDVQKNCSPSQDNLAGIEAQEWIRSAEEKIARLDYEGAIADYSKLLDNDAYRAKANNKIAWLYGEWATRLLTRGSVEEAAQKVRLGLEFTDNPSDFSKLQEQIDYAKHLLKDEAT